jgi:hypothetical protein
MLESSAIPELQPKAQPYKRFNKDGLFLLIWKGRAMVRLTHDEAMAMALSVAEDNRMR